MREPILPKKFIFNDNIDSAFLFNMYEDDFPYIEEIFKTTLDQLNSLIPEVESLFNGKDLNSLRKIIHKIKPAFGFTGFLYTEKACKDFEDASLNVTHVDGLSVLYHNLWILLAETMDIMQKQYDQLKEFNKP